jgi:chemotaxis signal transduction protein
VESWPVTEETGSEYTISYKNQELRVIDFSKRLKLDEKQVNNLYLTSSSDRVERDPIASELSSKILIIKHQYEGYIGVRIANPKKLITVSIDQIYALPVIMQKNKRIQGLWGIALVDDTPVILIDLERL